MIKRLYFKRKRVPRTKLRIVLRTKLRIVTISGRKARGCEGDRACRYKATSNVLVLKLDSRFPGYLF